MIHADEIILIPEELHEDTQWSGVVFLSCKDSRCWSAQSLLGIYFKLVVLSDAAASRSVLQLGMYGGSNSSVQGHKRNAWGP